MIKEQLKQENQRKLFEKLLFMTVRPEFNDVGVIEAVSIVLFTFYSFFGGFASVFRCFRFGVSAVPMVSVVSFRWFRFGVSGFSTCPVNITYSYAR